MTGRSDGIPAPDAGRRYDCLPCFLLCSSAYALLHNVAECCDGHRRLPVSDFTGIFSNMSISIEKNFSNSMRRSGMKHAWHA